MPRRRRTSGTCSLGRSLFHLRCEVGAYRVQIVLLDPQAGCSCGRLQALCGAWVMASVGALSAHSG
jgi:hypothetical protein